MKEQQFEQLKAQIEAAGERAGTPLGPEKWNLESKSGMAYLNTAIRVGQIHGNIPDRTLPKLQEKFAQMEAASRVGERQARVDDIAHMVEKGHLDQPVLDRAQEELTNLGSGKISARGQVTTAPTYQPTIEPPSPRPQEAEPTLPKITINLQSKEVYLNGNKRKIIYESLDQGEGRFLVLLAQLVNRDINSPTIDQLARLAGKEQKRAAAYFIKILRNYIEDNPTNPQIITRAGPSNRSIYRFNAHVEFIPEPPKETIAVLPEKTRGEKYYFIEEVQLPDGQKIELARILREITENLLITSKENPMPAEDLAQKLYDDQADIKTKTQRISTRLQALRPLLEEKGWKILNANPKGSAKLARYYLVKIVTEQEDVDEELAIEAVAASTEVESKPQKSTMLKIEEVVELDGQEIVFTPVNVQILGILKNASKEYPSDSEFLANLVFKEDVPLEVKVHRLQTHIWEMRPKLKERGYRIKNTGSRGKKGAQYFLEKIEAAEEETTSVKPIDEELILRARSYQKHLSAKELLLTEMREHAASVSGDTVVQQILERHEKELQILLKNKDTDPNLRKGLELLEFNK